MNTNIQNTRDIKFVRAVWGDMDLSSIPQQPQYNEIVYVWGTQNNNILKGLGYTTFLVDKNPTNFKYTSILYQFIHKLIAIKKAVDTYSKIMFLDWDYVLEKELDDVFFNYLQTKTFLAPIYSYSKEYFEVNSNLNDWGGKKYELIKNYGWETTDSYILPNAGVVYISDSSISNNLLNVAVEKNLTTLIEEFSITIVLNKSLNEYIIEHQPFFAYGRHDDLINEYVDSLMTTDIYFTTI